MNDEDRDLAARHIWFHSFDLGAEGEIRGTKPLAQLNHEWDVLALADLGGKTVLDVGAWDGWFSFKAEAAGAARVVSLDYYSWALNTAAQHKYFARCRDEGIAAKPWDQVPELWDSLNLPGRAGLDMLRRTIGSGVEPVVSDFPTTVPDGIGTFDVVLFLGVLYHLENPLDALRKLVAVTGGFSVIETVCAVLPGHEDHPWWEFFPGGELDGDTSNWWGPNARGLEAMCLAAGFSDVEFLARPGESELPGPGYDYHYGRAILRAYK